MLSIVFGVLIGIVIGYKIKDYPFGKVACSMVCGLLGVFVGILIAMLITLPFSYKPDRQIELVALQDTGGIEGSFFMGCGNIESTFYYAFYKRDSNGSIKFDRVEANNKVSIWEQEREGGIMNVFRRKPESKFLALFIAPERFVDLKYEIFIPKGSILRNFQLDLK